MPGHNNIFSGFDQLLPFFNNRTWKRDLPYGTRGWGPRGGRRYKRGTNYVPEDGPAYLHKGEAVIPKEFNKPLPTEAMKLLALAGKRIQGNKHERLLSKEAQEVYKENKHLENIVSKLSEQVEDTKEIVSLLAKLLMKDSDIYIDGKEITEAVNHHNALKSLNPF